MAQKSDLHFGERPDWYRKLKSKPRGDYFGSLRSLWPGQVFVTHDLMYFVFRDVDGKLTISRNACAHAGAPLFYEPGEKSVQEIRCLIHQWLYKPNGEVIATPHFKGCEKLKLQSAEFTEWNGYIVGYSKDNLEAALSGFGSKLGLPLGCINPEGFDYIEEKVDDVPYPRELLMINYFDGLHVPLSHQKTFDAVTDYGTYAWEFSPSHEGLDVGYSIQQVRARRDVSGHLDRLMVAHKSPSTAFGWADLHSWLREKLPDFATPIDRDIFAVWAAIYGNGNLMIELYEGGLLLAVSSVVNTDPMNLDTGNKNPVEFYIHRSIPEELRDVMKRKFVDAYMQSANEDRELCKKLWQAHCLGGMNFDRVYHATLEQGDLHWREWYKKHSEPRG